MPHVYKLLTIQEWEIFEKSGEFSGSPVDRTDGFIHLSYAHQVDGTARRHFAGRGDLVLLALASTSFGNCLKAEVSRGGEPFPHLYASFRREDVIWSRTLRSGIDGVVSVPDDLED